MKSITISVIILILYFPGFKLNAQPDSLHSGNRIRIAASKYFFQPVVCEFDKLQSDSLFVVIHSRTIGIPIQSIQKIELSKGTKPNTVKGIIAGSVSGGLVLGFAMHLEEQQAEGFGKVGQPIFWGGLAAGALIGGSFGALIGHNIHSDRWEEIPVIGK